jgi:hypothetical protein
MGVETRVLVFVWSRRDVERTVGLALRSTAEGREAPTATGVVPTGVRR